FPWGLVSAFAELRIVLSAGTSTRSRLRRACATAVTTARSQATVLRRGAEIVVQQAALLRAAPDVTHTRGATTDAPSRSPFRVGPAERGFRLEAPGGGSEAQRRLRDTSDGRAALELGLSLSSRMPRSVHGLCGVP